MTPEEHIAKAEWYLTSEEVVNAQAAIAAASVHVQIAFFKEQYPPEAGRPVPLRSSGRMHHHVKTGWCQPLACPAYGTDSTNYARPISDNPQA